MYKTLTVLLILFISSSAMKGQMTFRVMSYNVENLFDTQDNPLTDDDEFLPVGARHWSDKRYYHKLQQIAKVIIAAGEWETPALVGLCEIENDTVVTHLLRKTPLRNQPYRYCISNSSDRRGINVALLYRRDKFRYISHRSVPVKHRKGNTRSARDVLHVTGQVATGDTLDVMVCHFPSKYGGEKESEMRRMDAARTVRELCDSLGVVRTNPLIILMGDFNEPPESHCMQLIAEGNLHNLFAGMKGSHKYQGEWSQLDQLFVYRKMLSDLSRMRVVSGSVANFSPPFLFVEDKTWRGKRPHRSYYGYKYRAGYSDHLPIKADFLLSLP
ncbi:MAG: endonuclease [Tannerellaceae bacterium]|jgi:endonuclease/exonuclease/phosphatase family metal-dependent hydrolase|nr:endonuclease [Tannerellaceae bacterium]